MKKVIVTGASGFIGRQVISLLLKEEMEIHALSSQQLKEADEDNLVWHSLDLHDYDKVNDFCETLGADSLVHLAWYGGIQDRMSSLHNMAWVGASLHLVQSFAQAGGQRIVLAGSCAEYDWEYGYCREGITPTNPHSFYGQCKSSLHTIVEKYCQEKEISYACGRIFFVYGPHEFESRFVAYIINSLLQDNEAKLSHGTQMRDYLHVNDVAYALVELLKSNMVGPVNIASGQPVQLRIIADMIGDKLDKSELLTYASKEKKAESHPVVLADTARLRDELNWLPDYNLEEGITNTIEWWKNKDRLILSK